MILKALIPALALVASLSVAAQQTPATDHWPVKPVRLLVGFPAGSSPDTTARILAEPLARSLGQPVIVENRAGASGNIAADQVAKATDDHTIGLVINSTLTVAKTLSPGLPFDPDRDFSYLSVVASLPFVLVASGSVPTGKAFIDSAMKSGDTWNYGSVGNGSMGHLGMELLKSQVPGMRAVHIPFQGNPQVVTALIGGEIQVALLPPGVAFPHVKSGRLKVVGVTAKARSALVPDYPSLSEIGISGFTFDSWLALIGPSRLSPAAQAKLKAAIAAAVQNTDVQRQFAAQGFQITGGSPQAMRDLVKTERGEMESLIRRENIRLQ